VHFCVHETTFARLLHSSLPENLREDSTTFVPAKTSFQRSHVTASRRFQLFTSKRFQYFSLPSVYVKIACSALVILLDQPFCSLRDFAVSDVLRLILAGIRVSIQPDLNTVLAAAQTHSVLYASILYFLVTYLKLYRVYVLFQLIWRLVFHSGTV